MVETGPLTLALSGLTISQKIMELCNWVQVAQHMHICLTHRLCGRFMYQEMSLTLLFPSLITCWARWNKMIALYLLLLTQKKVPSSVIYGFVLFCLFLLLPCWSGSFSVSLVAVYTQTQARWLKQWICVKINVRNKEVEGSKYRS